MLVLLLSGTVLAHDPGLSAAEVRILPDRIVAEVSFARRWLVTFGFGLIHGLGFAQILRELGIATMGIQGAIPLLSFNLGVEVAQLSIAALTLPLIWRLQRRTAFMLKHVPALSLLLTLAGTYWFLARTVIQ
jgi:hypothetical protein